MNRPNGQPAQPGPGPDGRPPRPARQDQEAGQREVTWHLIQGTGFPDQEADLEGPYWAQIGPGGSTRPEPWSWTILRAGAAGGSCEVDGGEADGEEEAKAAAAAWRPPAGEPCDERGAPIRHGFAVSDEHEQACSLYPDAVTGPAAAPAGTWEATEPYEAKPGFWRGRAQLAGGHATQAELCQHPGFSETSPGHDDKSAARACGQQLAGTLRAVGAGSGTPRAARIRAVLRLRYYADIVACAMARFAVQGLGAGQAGEGAGPAADVVERAWRAVASAAAGGCPGAGQVPGRDYEGHVRYADGSIVSLQCFEGRHGQCPDVTRDGQAGDNGPLDGYHCECHACPDHPAGKADRPVAARFFGAQLRWYAADGQAGDGSDMYALDVLGVSILVRRREGDTYVHIDTRQLAEAPRLPLAVEVNNGGEATHGAPA